MGKGRDGTGHGMGGERMERRKARERRKGREREERGYSPQTSIPGAATADTGRQQRPRLRIASRG